MEAPTDGFLAGPWRRSTELMSRRCSSQNASPQWPRRCPAAIQVGWGGGSFCSIVSSPQLVQQQKRPKAHPEGKTHHHGHMLTQPCRALRTPCSELLPRHDDNPGSPHHPQLSPLQSCELWRHNSCSKAQSASDEGGRGRCCTGKRLQRSTLLDMKCNMGIS